MKLSRNCDSDGKITRFRALVHSSCFQNGGRAEEEDICRPQFEKEAVTVMVAKFSVWFIL